MANPTCSSTTLITQAKCYIVPPLNAKDQKALLVYAKALELQAIGGGASGTNYLTTLSTTLLANAATLTCGMDEANRLAARVNLAFTNATSAGASVPSTLAAKMAVIKCLLEADPEALDEADLLLTCKLGFHKPYTQ